MPEQTTIKSVVWVNNAVNQTASLPAQSHIPSESQITPEPVFLSMHDAAKLTGYHQDYLGQMARSGKLDARKVGRNWQTTKEAINKMLGREQAASEQVSTVQVQPTPVKILAPVIIKKKAPEPVAIHKPDPIIRLVNSPIIQSPNISIPKTHKLSDRLVVAVNKIRTAPEAGPNVQEAIAFCTPQKIQPVKIASGENKNTFFRLAKLGVGNNNFKSQVIYPSVAVSPDIEQSQIVNQDTPKNSSGWFQKFSLVGVTAIIVIGAWGFGQNILEQQINNIMGSVGTPQKFVAGESTTASQPVTGSQIILAGQNTAVVINENVNPDSLVLVTFRTSHTGSYWISNQANGEFTLSLSVPAEQNLTFDYWIGNNPEANEGGPP